LSAEERSEYLVGVDAEGRLVDTRGKPLGTELTSIFCLDHNGGLYVAETCFLSAANGNANAHRTIHHPVTSSPLSLRLILILTLIRTLTIIIILILTLIRTCASESGGR